MRDPNWDRTGLVAEVVVFPRHVGLEVELESGFEGAEMALALLLLRVNFHMSVQQAFLCKTFVAHRADELGEVLEQRRHHLILVEE